MPHSHHPGDDHQDDDHAQVGHDHAHLHAPVNFGRAFAIGLALNVGFVVIEVVFGFLSNSVSLVADAGHNLSDALGLGVAWTAAILGKQAPTRRFSYGLGGSSILAALFNAVLLLMVTGGLAWEAISRLFHPEPVAGATVMIVAACGIAVNGLCAWLFASGRKGDLNVGGAFMHMAADALVSLGVVFAGLVIAATGWLWVDPLTSLVVNAAIIWSAWSLLKSSLAMSLDAVPANIEIDAVRAYLASLASVVDLHDLHVWSLSTTETALTCHLVTPDGRFSDEMLSQTARELKEKFGIGHATIQLERAGTACHLAEAHR